MLLVSQLFFTQHNDPFQTTVIEVSKSLILKRGAWRSKLVQELVSVVNLDICELQFFVDGFWKLKRYGICVDGDGDILVSEAEHGQVLIFKADGSGPEVVADEGQLITRRGLGSNKFAFRSFATNGNWHYPRGLLGSLRPLQSLYQIIPVQTWSKRKRRGNGSRSSGKNQYHKL